MSKCRFTPPRCLWMDDLPYCQYDDCHFYRPSRRDGDVGICRLEGSGADASPDGFAPLCLETVKTYVEAARKMQATLEKVLGHLKAGHPSVDTTGLQNEVLSHLRRRL